MNQTAIKELYAKSVALLDLASLIHEALGCQCLPVSELHTTGLTCGVCRWIDDTAAIVGALGREAQKPDLRSALPAGISELVEAGRRRIDERRRRAEEARRQHCAKVAAEWQAVRTRVAEQLPEALRLFLYFDGEGQLPQARVQARLIVEEFAPVTFTAHRSDDYLLSGGFEVAEARRRWSGAKGGEVASYCLGSLQCAGVEEALAVAAEQGEQFRRLQAELSEQGEEVAYGHRA